MSGWALEDFLKREVPQVWEQVMLRKLPEEVVNLLGMMEIFERARAANPGTWVQIKKGEEELCHQCDQQDVDELKAKIKRQLRVLWRHMAQTN
jgi:hypothetical protein